MFNAIMDPELIKLAQEQMGRMSPADLAKMQQQMMSNPELMKMASESMKDMTPEDLRIAAQQMKQTRPEMMTEISERISSATPDELAAMRARADSQLKYELNAAEMLKSQGNELHSVGKFRDASEKYLLAKKNVKGNRTSKGKTLLLACSLNLMSCYLKTRQYDECIKEGSEVLEYDMKNLKALYRRGQAYKELGQLKDAVADLSRAHEITPDDETIADLLRDAKVRLIEVGVDHASKKLVIEEITEEMPSMSSQNNQNSSTEYSMVQPSESSDCSTSEEETNRVGQTTNVLQALKDDPQTIGSFHNFISNADPKCLDAMNAGKAGVIPHSMLKTASNMISKMSPEELKRMIDMSSLFPDANLKKFQPGSVPPDMSPDMITTATDMISNMSPEDLQKMASIASTMKGVDKESFPVNEIYHSSEINSVNDSTNAFEVQEARNAEDHVSEASSSCNLFSTLKSAPESTFPNSTTNFQEQMHNQMNDPAMRQMFTSMIKNMNPDMMANMGKQFGLNLSKEDAEKAQEAMSSLSPEALDRMMLWAGRIQSGADYARRTKNWLLGKGGMILAICMLLFAVILHRFGYIGA